METSVKLKIIVKLKKVLQDVEIYYLPLQYYIGGSSCLDFIDDPSNFNIIVVYTNSPTNPMNESVKNKINSIAKENNFDLTFVDKYEPTIYDWLYANSYINIFGSDNYNLNLLNEPEKIINLVKEHYKKYSENKKRMFEIIYYYFIIQNNKYELYPYQKNKLANWHKGIYDEELLERIINELNLKGE